MTADQAKHASSWRTGLCLLASDSVAFGLALLVSWCLREPFADDLSFIRYLDILAVLPGIWVLFFVQRLYPAVLYPPQEEFAKLVCQTSLAFLAAWALMYFSRSVLYSRLIFFGTWLFCLLLMPMFRHFVRQRFSGRAWWGHDVVICGDGPSVLEMSRHLENRLGVGLKPIALCALDGSLPEQEGLRVCSLEELLEMGRLPSRPYALLTVGSITKGNREVITLLTRYFAKTLFVFGMLGPMHLWVSSTDLGGRIALETRQKLLDRGRQRFKRGFDLAVSLLCLCFALPLGLVLALLIKSEDGGPALYSQPRLGRNGKTIRIWKFRTMLPEADDILAGYLTAHPDQAVEWAARHKLSHDPRITRIGRFLRRTSLDELPQLWNVLRGDLSLVGPRPIVESEIVKYGPVYELYSRVRPGLTGLWQVSGRSSLSYAQRVALDSYYIRNWSVWFDLYILARTPFALTRTGNAV